MRFDPNRLAREMARRGLDQATCARLAGVSPATMCQAAAGRRLRLKSARAIARALQQAPVVEAIEQLLPQEQ